MIKNHDLCNTGEVLAICDDQSYLHPILPYPFLGLPSLSYATLSYLKSSIIIIMQLYVLVTQWLISLRGQLALNLPIPYSLPQLLDLPQVDLINFRVEYIRL